MFVIRPAEQHIHSTTRSPKKSNWVFLSACLPACFTDSLPACLTYYLTACLPA